MSESKWNVVKNKKSSTCKTTGKNINKNINKTINMDPIISRQIEAKAKIEEEKQTKKQIKYAEQLNPNQNWDNVILQKAEPKKKTSVSKAFTSIKENSDGEIKIKKVSKSMSKSLIDARIAKKWTRIQLAHNSATDVKTITEIETGGCVYDANIFNKLCKSLGVNIERNFDIV